ncbi:hypothetical protein F8388_014884 [Cannabis sativa]|uniref:Uncharacterized protein n=1 Tax=Cannabis sativa TaxID=3483 RepID=A0A7J6F690_CANSA|nr:hypothetical protein F8388_014884 [Cannabis sativa]
MEGAENEFSNGRLMIPCYEGYFDEMKRDGRVVTDWTTYGKAGLFKKAEAARNDSGNGNHGAQHMIIVLQIAYAKDGLLDKALELKKHAR